MAWQSILFTTDFSDDGIETGEGDDWQIVRPSGMALAGTIAELLRSVGMIVQEPESDIEHYSWEFPATYENRHYWVQLVDLGDEKILTTKGHSPLFQRWFNRRDHYAEFLEIVRGLLVAHPKIASVKWYYTDQNGNSRPRR